MGTPHFHRDHVGPRGPYGNTLDRFALRCVFDNRSFVVMIDTHHRNYADDRQIEGLELSARTHTRSLIRALYGIPAEPGVSDDVD